METGKEQLNKFFGEFFQLMRRAEPSTYDDFMRRAEEEFVRLGYREEISQSIENILIVRLDVIGDMVLTSGFLREVRANFPRARITLVVSPLVYQPRRKTPSFSYGDIRRTLFF